MKRLAVFLSSFLLFSCSSTPKNVTPISGFDVNRYTGTWYEIARLDHRFERGLEQVTATYTLNDDGTIRVENRGFSTKKQKWQDATGKAKFAQEPDTGFLKVSFFGPFYGSYVIFELDKDDYQYAFISGGEDYLWLLSRTPTISDELRERFLSTAQEAGFDTDALIFVDHE